jgi:hypothetical protein
MGPDSSAGIATRCGLDGAELETHWVAKFFAPVQVGPGAHPASCFFSRVKSQGPGVNHPPPFRDEVKERGELYHYFPSGPSWHVLGWTLPFMLEVFGPTRLPVFVHPWSKV